MLRGCKPRTLQTMQSLAGAPVESSQNMDCSLIQKVTFKGAIFIDQDAVGACIWAWLY